MAAIYVQRKPTPGNPSGVTLIDEGDRLESDKPLSQAQAEDLIRDKPYPAAKESPDA